jgi:AraC family transcriptional regulator of arabinose operon
MAKALYVSRQETIPGRLWIRRLGVDQVTAPCLIARRREEWFLSWFHGPAEVADRFGAHRAIAGDAICYAPGEAQRFGNRERRWRNSWLALSGPQAATWLADFPCGRLLHLEDHDAPRWTLLALHHELARYAQPNPGIVANLVENLLAALTRQVGRSQARSLPPEAQTAWTALAEGFSDPRFSIEGLARRVALSPSALSRAFKRHFGCAPAEALQRLRLDRAQELLGGTDATVAEAATEAGYADHRYFARVVRRRLGCSPRELRERLRRRADPPPERASELS